MQTTTRKPRHRSHQHRKLNTAQAILAVAEEMCASVGANNLKLTDIAEQLGIEPPAIYRHYKGLDGVIAALGEVALIAEIESFDGIEQLPFDEALRLQAERCFDLYMQRPGLARFMMIDLAVPGGVHVFDDNDNLRLIKVLFGCESDLLRRGIENGSIRPMSLTSFIAAKLGPAITTFAMKDMTAFGSKPNIEMLRKEYLETVMAALRPI